MQSCSSPLQNKLPTCHLPISITFSAYWIPNQVGFAVLVCSDHRLLPVRTSFHKILHQVIFALVHSHTFGLRLIRLPLATGIDYSRVIASGEMSTVQLTRLLGSTWGREGNRNDWCESLIVPIYKKGNTSPCENCRRIILVSNVSELLLTIVVRQLSSTRERYRSENQAIFRPSRACIDQIFNSRQILEQRHSIGSRLLSFRIWKRCLTQSVVQPSLSGGGVNWFQLSTFYLRTAQAKFALMAVFLPSSPREVVSLRLALFHLFSTSSLRWL